MKTDILILGAGIGGFETFRTLSKQLRRAGLRKTITIVDQNNYFVFTPLLHEVASGAVEPSHAALPLRELVYRTPHCFFKARVQKIIPDEKKVITSEGTINYEFCVTALGSGVNFYGTPGAEKFAYTVRTLPAAMRLREAIIKKLEGTHDVTDITVVGGGYTGVEVAGQLAHLINHDLKKLYPDDVISINLIQNGSTLVPILPLKAQKLIGARLAAMRVKIFFNSKVKEVKKNSVTLENESLPSDITVWCAGNENDMALCIDPAYCEKGRLPVTHFLNHAMNPTLYGVGDIIMGANPGEAVLYPQLGEAAHEQGRYVAKHIMATLTNKSIKPFYFKSMGTLMPIGDRYGIVVLGNSFIISGWFAWWIRRTVYLLVMPGLLRKLKIVIDWTLRLFGFRDIIDVERK